MKIKQLLAIVMMGLAPFSTKAQRAVQIIPEAGAFGTVKSAQALGGVNFVYPKGNNSVDVFVGGSMNKDAVPGFVGMAIDNYSWSKYLSSWIRYTFMAAKNATSTLNFAPAKFDTKLGKFNFSIMPAYSRNNDFVNRSTTHSLTGIFQTMFSITPKDRLTLEMQYGTVPKTNFSTTYFGNFFDNFGFTATYSKIL